MEYKSFKYILKPSYPLFEHWHFNITEDIRTRQCSDLIVYLNQSALHKDCCNPILPPLKKDPKAGYFLHIIIRNVMATLVLNNQRDSMRTRNTAQGEGSVHGISFSAILKCHEKFNTSWWVKY